MHLLFKVKQRAHFAELAVILHQMSGWLACCFAQRMQHPWVSFTGAPERRGTVGSAGKPDMVLRGDVTEGDCGGEVRRVGRGQGAKKSGDDERRRRSLAGETAAFIHRFLDDDLTFGILCDSPGPFMIHRAFYANLTLSPFLCQDRPSPRRYTITQRSSTREATVGERREIVAETLTRQPNQWPHRQTKSLKDTGASACYPTPSTAPSPYQRATAQRYGIGIRFKDHLQSLGTRSQGRG